MVLVGAVVGDSRLVAVGAGEMKGMGLISSLGRMPVTAGVSACPPELIHQCLY